MSTLVEMYLEHSKTSKMEICMRIVNSNKILTILANISTPDVWQGYKYTPDICVYLEAHFTKKEENVKVNKKLKNKYI